MNTDNKDQQANVKVHKADATLQAKVGTGPLDEKAVERCQKVMDNNDVDFTPLGMQFLDQLEEAIKNIDISKESKADDVQAMTAPVMQLKANAATFHYALIGNLANVMLSFLESIKTLDEDAVSIVTAHHQTLKVIVMKQMKGDGGEVGQQMQDELKGACQRYFAKRK